MARGTLYGSLPECLAALKHNRIQLGNAPVRIDLAGATIEDASSVVAAAVGEGDVMITSSDPDPPPEFA